MNNVDTVHPPTQTSPEAHGRRKHRARRWVLHGFLLLMGPAVLYVLSMGPALRLNQQGVLKLETFEAMYLPLSIVADGIPGAQGLIERYVTLWVTPDPSGL